MNRTSAMMKILTLVFCIGHAFTASSKDYLISQLGVGSDSTKIHTKEFQQIIDLAQVHGGGTIVVPKGVYLTGALFFKPGTKLHLQEGAILKGSDDINDYPLMPSRMEGRRINYNAALINAYQVDGFDISGPGTINGNGLKFWKSFWAHRDSLKKIGKVSTNLEVHRPRLIFIWGCKNVTIRDVKLCNSGFWTTHLYQCQNVLIENCDIRSPYKPIPAPSTDGIDIDVCKNITIKNCYISVNDDGVCIKGGKGPDAHQLSENGIVEDVLVENCTFGAVHATLTFGSESFHAKNITMRNCKVDNNSPILNFKMRPDTYQIFENIMIENITGKCRSIIEVKPWTQFFDLGNSSEKPYGIVRNIRISNINVQCQNIGIFEGNPSDQVSNINLKDIEVRGQNTSLKSKFPDIKMENVLVNGILLAAQ